MTDWVATVGGAGTGLLTVFCRHTSASLLVQENADPEVLARPGPLLLAAWFRTEIRSSATPPRARTTCRRTSARH